MGKAKFARLEMGTKFRVTVSLRRVESPSNTIVISIHGPNTFALHIKDSPPMKFPITIFPRGLFLVLTNGP